jgi:signal transduction histidine kinase
MRPALLALALLAAVAYTRAARGQRPSNARIAVFAVGLVLIVAALAQLLEPSCCNPPLIVRWPALAFIVATWVLVTGAGDKSLGFLLLVLPPVAARMVWSFDDLTPLFLLLVAAWAGYTAAAALGLIVVALSVVAIVPEMIVLHVEPYLGLAWWLGIFFSWLTAYLLARQRRLLLALRAAQAELTARAVTEERHRIAREVHDAIAHALTVTMLQITGARHVLTRDPAAADAALAEAERLGRQSLADIRRSIGLLNRDTNANATAPLPTIGDLPELVAELRRAGLDVDLRLEGEASRLAGASSVNLYRIAQEALANAAKHAPGARVAVELAIDDTAARLSVLDTGASEGARSPAAGGSGLGIAGMRERAAALGGNLRAERLGNGWLVECSVPMSMA